GARDDIPALLGALDLFIFPSHYEGLGIALIEAQAAGVPVLASRAVPAESDVGLGLVRFASLEEGPARWAAAGAGLAAAPRPAWEERRRAIEAAGYDLERLVARLTAWYGTEGAPQPCSPPIGGGLEGRSLSKNT
ncbi:MAG TPA: glycosyltransferase, partial [Roseiflexaceae bacterium]|nr:glycosyltransferase [Roseiflexaceae bacterium]